AETPEVIDVEEYDIQNGGVLNGNNVDNKNKGKAIDFDSVTYDEQDDSGDDYDYPGSSPISNSLLDPDTLIYEDDENYSEQYDFEMAEETDNYSMYQDLFDGKDIPTGVEVSMDWFPNSADKESSNKSDATGNSSKKATKGSGIQSQFYFPDPVAQPCKAFQPPFTLGSSTSKTYFSNHFQPQTPDTVLGELGEAPAPAAAFEGLGEKLEKDLPDMIFVRAYESRMDLLRAVIIGAQGTPYHDGLFFFDIFFPDTYPSVPPVNCSGGLRINPNLYNCGKVCLSLLGTWSGSQREKWIPNTSTMLQGAQDAEENSAEGSSKKFRTDVATFVETVLLKEFILLGVLGLEPEGEDKAPETNNVAESSNSTRSSAKRDRVSSS
ncbi:unnamed protein product, partial [Arabidopsis halleri]